MSKGNRTIVIMAGGTGGHVFPALATAQALRDKNIDVHWIGTKKGIEAQIIPAADIPISFIDVSGLRGNGLARLIAAPLQLTKALLQSLKCLREIRPQGVLGMGGFVTGPAGLAAWMLRIPILIHEQNAVAGLSNRLLSRLSKRILAAFPGAFDGSRVARNLVVTGNPIRLDIASIPGPGDRLVNREGTVRLLILGGSLGALTLNEMVPEAISYLGLSERPDIIHQAGKRNYETAREHYEKFSVVAEVRPFIEDMAHAYEWADLVICRAGALTVSEVSAAGVAAIFIPYPHAVDDHQTKNAEYLETAGAAVIVQQNNLDGKRLTDLLKGLLGDRKALLEMAVKARSLAKPKATDTVVSNIMEVCYA
ncbi:MAG: undecaprenyldiphospho-muramoylpentapeptide beta-N-acetylglucosaminyltransferase [Pseudomonadales bacterium]|nr:undecaprenyldiphospho-muramoylpentapeptide beta-N-acetylglucosaminyltransferase [Pseudomonadales bacterium]